MAEETKEAKSLASAVDALKATIAIATGTLVFSAGLLKENVQLTCAGKLLLVVRSFNLKIDQGEDGPYEEAQIAQMVADGSVDRHTPCKPVDRGEWND